MNFAVGAERNRQLGDGMSFRMVHCVLMALVAISTAPALGQPSENDALEALVQYDAAKARGDLERSARAASGTPHWLCPQSHWCHRIIAACTRPGRLTRPRST